MKYFATAILVAAVNSAASDFPKFDSFHAHCAMSADYPDTQCESLWTEMDAEIRSWNVTDPSGGVYSIYEEQDDSYIWSTRLTRDRNYTDDQIFEFSQVGTTCHVAARSRSQSNSYYDYDVNYCNMWNVMSRLPTMEDLTLSKCQFYPTDPVTTCARY